MRLLFFILIMCVSEVFPQSPEAGNLAQTNFRFSHLSVADGLSPGIVNCFHKDSKGFIWIGTSSGLNRFDGYEIRSFNPEPTDSLALQSKDYKKIFEDPLGNIWVQTSRGINIFDPQTERFSSNQYAVLKELGLQEEPVKDIIRDSCGNYWFLQQNSRITKYTPGNKEKSPELAFRTQFVLYGTEITSFAETSDGDFWLIYNNGILEKINAETLEVIQSNKTFSGLFNGDLHDFRLVVDNDDDLWIHLYGDHGIYLFDTKKNEVRNFNTTSHGLKLSSDLIMDVVIDPSGDIWIGTNHGGIDVINKKDLSVFYILNNPQIKNSLSHNSTASLYRDYDGIIWVGTFKNGVDYYHKNIFKFPHQENLISNPYSLPFNDVNVFAEDDKGNLWIGTNGGGLLHLNRKTWQYTQYLHDPNDASSISSNIIVSLLFDSKGDLWAGTYLGGLNKLQGRSFKKYMHDSEDPTSIGGISVWELFEDSRGYMWIGNLNGGLDVFDPETEKFIHSKNHNGGSPMHNNDYISSIEEDLDGNIWIGGGNGLDVFHPVTGERKYFSSLFESDRGLSSNNILEIFRDSHGNMWIGTEEGLDLYNPGDDSFFHYNLADGLPGRNVISITEDDCENLWLTSSYGLAQFKTNKRESCGRIVPNFRNYDEMDGLQGKLFNENAIFKTSQGELLVGGLNGFNIFKPQDFGFNLHPPKIMFTSFSLFNEPIRPNQKKNGRIILDGPIQEVSNIRLKYDENLFSVEFAALDFFQPTKNNYQYKLVGFDQEWQEVGSNNRRVTYTNLDPGKYELKVKASNNDQVWNNEGISLGITVLPPYYQTAYAYILYFLIAVAALYYSRNRIIKRQREKFRVEQEKIEADHLHKVDLMKIRFFTNISHEFKSPLSLILAPLEKLKSRETNAKAQEQLETINKNAKRLYALINEILDLGNIQNTRLLSTSRGNVMEFVEQTVDSFRILYEKKNITLTYKTETSNFHTSYDMDKLDKILFNLLSNAYKFTPEYGQVSVCSRMISYPTSQNKKYLQVKVKDTGLGISPEDQLLIFDRFFKVDQTGISNKSGSGIGLSLVKEYVDLFGGEITIESEPEKGSEFTVNIPLEELPCPKRVQDAKIKVEELEEAALLTGRSTAVINDVPTLLLIEDDEDFLNYLTNSFRGSFKVFVASNGLEGWKKTLAVQPDLIISDWSMPGMDGTELCEKIRNDSRTKHIPFVLLTGNTDEESIMRGLKTGISDYVVKPFNFNVLFSRVQNLIKQRKIFQEAYRKKLEVETKKVNFEPEDDIFMRKVIKIIEKNIDNTYFSVEKLASELGVSRTFLYNKMVTRLEKSPNEVIRDMRLDLGKELLLKSKLTVSEIAFKVGYNNPKYFTKNFKKRYNSLPSEFKSQEPIIPS